MTTKAGTIHEAPGAPGGPPRWAHGMKTATGTSLFVIAANSSVALLAHRHSLDLGGVLLLELVPAALLATYLGVRLAQKLSAHQLREIFGAFVILLGVLMAVYNTAVFYRR